MKRRSLIIIICLIAGIFMFATNASAVWYTCYVDKVVPWADGQVRLQLVPGPGEDAFDGTVRMYTDTSQPGGKNMLATILTAISLGTEITAMSSSVAKWDPVVECTGVALVAP